MIRMEFDSGKNPALADILMLCHARHVEVVVTDSGGGAWTGMVDVVEESLVDGVVRCSATVIEL